MAEDYTITGLYYPSFYIKDFAKAVEFYTSFLGTPQTDLARIKGWKLGNTWLTLFPSEDMGIRSGRQSTQC